MTIKSYATSMETVLNPGQIFTSALALLIIFIEWNHLLCKVTISIFNSTIGYEDNWVFQKVQDIDQICCKMKIETKLLPAKYWGSGLKDNKYCGSH